ncbi:glucan endo-1,3-beta-D-glucosidase-like [Bidens hawaiensis]|uniref:glucan endo-1,3-beta-D-glucosidase-like n=1 Tax=Bidens hawaiensis TaxID=980011 RepID=UPI0040491A9D
MLTIIIILLLLLSSLLLSIDPATTTFPDGHSTVLPDPSTFFSPNLISSPLPTNTFFTNLIIENGTQHEYIHPYTIKSSHSTLSLSYPSLFSNSSFTQQIFTPDINISVLRTPKPNRNHTVSSFSDLSVTLDFKPFLRFFLVRGTPYLTCQVLQNVPLSISTVHNIINFVPNGLKTKYKIFLSNGQVWILYSSTPIGLTRKASTSTIVSEAFRGVIRLALLPNANSEQVLDKFSSCYPVSGHALFRESFSVEYRWKSRGLGDLLMLANPLHLKLIKDSSVKILDDFKYQSVDGELVGVVGSSWKLKTDPVKVTWHSIKGVEKDSYPEIVKALVEDVKGLDSSNMSTNSSYFYGKLVARAARLALIAEEVDHVDVIPKVERYLKDTIEPWLDGTFVGNGFLYDKTWGGIITRQGSNDRTGDFGFGIFNDHHFHIGYFLYGIAVLAKIDPVWGEKYRPQAYSLMLDFMTLGKGSDLKYTRLRMFDLWKLHSWASGLNEFEDGRNQESTSEAVNAYYAAALMGLAYDDPRLVALGSLLMSLEIRAAQTWWHVKEGSTLYGAEFTRANRVVGILWQNKRDSVLWFAPAEQKEFRLGIQLLPVLPVSEVLFSDHEYAKQLVEWTLPSLKREGVGEGWKGFVYALEGVYDKEIALKKIRKLTGHDDGNSLSNMLWWIFSR